MWKQVFYVELQQRVEIKEKAKVATALKTTIRDRRDRKKAYK